MNPRPWLERARTYMEQRLVYLILKQDKLISAQARIIDHQEQQLNYIRLNHFREVNALVEGWLIHHEQPDIDMRPELLKFNQDLSDRIAALEELIV